ncbi:hypothetical protein MNB_SV-4-616 [hydrothermal vent metagenome]|uniref:Porin n=1 Tax=hydrothermal vent metagenome TaxID=652676 RepID=A0A1W1EAS3_9ZZZZ
MLALSAYTVINPAINQNSLHTNPDFFDASNKSFALLSKAYIDGKWHNTEVKLGRQSLDTPFADSDDIRMMPNFFNAYTLKNTDIAHLTLQAGFIDKMAGWENGVDSSRFVDIAQVLGTDDTNGIYYASAAYDIDDLSLSLWYYRYTDIADILYAEAGYAYTLFEYAALTLGLQFSDTHQTGAALLGTKNAHTFGVSTKIAFASLGITLLGAYNKDNGKSGACDLSLGGGPYFTSMEDQTIDAIGAQGSAWMGAVGYDLSALGIKNMTCGIAFGKFTANEENMHYHTKETDIVVEYAPLDQFTMTAAYARVNHKDDNGADFSQFRLIVSYSF